jgi:WD40 repeat protein
VNFTNSWLNNAQLQGALMDGVQFREYYNLIFDQDVRVCCYSKDGSRLAIAVGTCQEPGTIYIYNMPTQTLIKTIQGHKQKVNSMSFSVDGTRLASGSDDGKLRIWCVQSGVCEKTLNYDRNKVTKVSFSPNGKYLSSSSLSLKSDILRLWDVNDGHLIMQIVNDPTSSKLSSFTFSPDSSYLALGSWDGTIRFWDVKKNVCKQVLKGHFLSVSSITFSPDGSRLVSGSWDNTLRIWNTYSGECEETLKGHTSEVLSVDFSPDGTRLVSGSSDGTLRLWNAHTGLCERIIEEHSDLVTSVVFSPDGKHVVSGSFDKTVRLWNVNNRSSCERMLKSHTHWASVITFSLDGMSLISLGDDGARLWDAQSGVYKGTLKNHSNCTNNSDPIQNNECSSLVLPPCANKTHLGEAQGGAYEEDLKGDIDFMSSTTFNSKDTAYSALPVNNMIYLWNTQSGICERKLNGHTYEVWVTAFSPDSAYLASGDADGVIRFWSIKGDFELADATPPLTPKPGGVRSCCWHPRKMPYLASAYNDGSIRYWQLIQGHGSTPTHLRLIWASKQQQTLNVTGCNIADVQNLSASNTLLLEQKGARGKPAQLVQSTRARTRRAADSAISVSSARNASGFLRPSGIQYGVRRVRSLSNENLASENSSMPLHKANKRRCR